MYKGTIVWNSSRGQTWKLLSTRIQKLTDSYLSQRLYAICFLYALIIQKKGMYDLLILDLFLLDLVMAWAALDSSFGNNHSKIPRRTISVQYNHSLQSSYATYKLQHCNMYTIDIDTHSASPAITSRQVYQKYNGVTLSHSLLLPLTLYMLY